MELFYNGNGEESQNNQKKNQNPNKSINKVNFIVRWMGTSAICIFGTHNMNFLYFAHLYRQIELDRPRILRKTDFLVLFQACISFVVNENLNIF